MRLILSILSLFATLTAAQPVGNAVDSPVTIQPTHRLSFPDSPDIGSVAFSPDGKILYVHLRPEAVDVWAMLVYVWPEGLGAVVGIAAVVAGLVAWRVRRRPQKKGAMYCRKCNYEMSGLPAGVGKCPECGVDLGRRRPRRGRGAWSRLGPVVAVVVVLGGVYGGMWWARLPREGSASWWLTWNSVTLHEMAAARGITSLSNFDSHTDRVVEVDSATGGTIRTLFSQSWATYFPIRVVPDGSRLILGGGQSRLLLVDCATGRVEGHLDYPANGDGFSSWKRIVGFSSDGGRAFCSYLNHTSGFTELVQWDLGAGSSKVVGRVEAFGGQWPKHLVLTSSDGDPAFISVSDFMEVMDTKSCVVQFHGSSLDNRPPLTLPAKIKPNAPPAVTRDGRRLYAVRNLKQVLAIDLQTGNVDAIIDLPGSPKSLVLDQFAASADGVWLFVEGIDSVLALRISTTTWAACLPAPAGYIDPQPFVSPDGRWLAAIPFKQGGGGPGGTTREVLLFDLTQLPKQAASDAR